MWLHQDVRAEWVDGTIEQRPSESLDHQTIAGHIFALLWMHRDTYDREGRVFSRFLMRLVSRPSCREPDIAVVRGVHADRVTEYWIAGPADLVVEIVSPESVTRDQQEKLAEYEAAGVPEYWVIDPLRRVQQFYQLDATGRYRLVPVDEDGIYTSREVPGFRLRVSWLWHRPFLTPAQAFADLPAMPGEPTA